MYVSPSSGKPASAKKRIGLIIAKSYKVGVYASSKTNSKVFSSTALYDLIWLVNPNQECLSLFKNIESKFFFTLFALKSLPSENFTPFLK